MLHIELLENGNLSLTVPSTEDRDELQHDINEQRGYWNIMSELFEDYACNGSYTHFDSSQANPFVGMTEAPCIAESMDISDDGDKIIGGKYWYFANYVFEVEAELLAKGETVIYTLVS